MAPASSSALRKDSAADGPAYGSLTAISGPRKFKKKPVLVLAPEELEAAHAMFQEASAELCGEEVERAPKPATVLGLAPMLDDPDELGASDEAGVEDDDEIVDTEAVLSLTQRKSNAIPIDEYFGEELGDEDIYGASAPGLNGAGDGTPAPDSEITDGLDLSKRIFPSLNLAQDDEATDFSPVGAYFDAGEDATKEPANQTGDEEEDAPEAKTASEPAGEAEASEAEEAQIVEPTPEPGKIPLDAKLMDYKNVAPPEEASHEADEPLEQAKTSEPKPSVDASDNTPHDHPRPARFDEVNPNRPQDEDDVFDLDMWLAEEQDEPTIVERPYTYEPKASAPDEPVEAAAPEGPRDPDPADVAAERTPAQPDPARVDPHEDIDAALSADGVSYTVPDDGVEVDGYAFMSNEKRSRPLPAQQAGRQNSLRAKLAKEEPVADDLPMREIEEPYEARSVLVRFWVWLKSLFS